MSRTITISSWSASKIDLGVLGGILVQARADLGVHARHPRRRGQQAVSVGVLADRLEDLAYRLLDAGQVDRCRCRRDPTCGISSRRREESLGRGRGQCPCYVNASRSVSDADALVGGVGVVVVGIEVQRRSARRPRRRGRRCARCRRRRRRDRAGRPSTSRAKVKMAGSGFATPTTGGVDHARHRHVVAVADLAHLEAAQGRSICPLALDTTPIGISAARPGARSASAAPLDRVPPQQGERVRPSSRAASSASSRLDPQRPRRRRAS